MIDELRASLNFPYKNIIKNKPSVNTDGHDKTQVSTFKIRLKTAIYSYRTV